MFIPRKDFEALQREITQLENKVAQLCEEQQKKQDYGSMSTALMRRLLGSIGSSEEPNDEVFNNRAGAIFDIVEPKLNKMVRTQERFTTAEAADWFQAVFGRGTLNGIELVFKEFKDANDIYQEAHKPPEPFDERNPLPEL